MRADMARVDTPVLIVDDHGPFRAIARTVVSVTPGFDLVGEAASGEEAVRLATELAPGVVLMDINLPGIDGLEATRQIIAVDPATIVVLLSTYSDRDLPPEAATCGAARYVHKEHFGPDVLTDVWVSRPDGPGRAE